MESSIRINCMAGVYSQIAMDNFTEAKTQADRMLQGTLSDREFDEVYHHFTKNVIIVITFAAMALESFLNDYGARKFGDNFYYDHFEMLRPTGKLQLLARFGAGAELDKGGYVFQLVAKLFRLRNELVHNKSKDGTDLLMKMAADISEEEQKYIDEQLQDSGRDFTGEREEVKKNIKNASDAIAAICETASFFDRYDEECHAGFFLGVSGSKLYSRGDS